MARVTSKALLLVALLGSLQTAASIHRAGGVRELSFQHPIEPHLPHQGVSKGTGSSLPVNKSGKSTRDDSGDSPYYYDYQKHGKKEKKGKSSKSGKKEKHYYKHNKYEVEMEVVVDYSKSTKGVPKFEFIEIGHKSWKSSKDSKSGGAGNEGDGTMYAKDAKSSKDGKKPKSYGSNGNTNKQTKAPSTVSSYPVAPTSSAAPYSSPSTPVPTMLGSFGVKIPEYSLAYNLLTTLEPTNKELSELEVATTSYLDDFFVDEFDKDDFTVFEVFTTEIVDSSTQGKVVVVSFGKSVARFDGLSLIAPTSEQLDSAVVEAFTGLHMIQYEDWLKQMLPSNNIFIGSKVQYLQDDEGIADKARRGIGATGIAASAVAFTLLVAGAVLYKSKSGDREGQTDKLNKAPGDMTVAGETFAGETYDGTFAGDTYDGTASVSAASIDYVRRFDGDEEDGIKKDNLGAIPEKPWGDDDSDGENGEPNSGGGIPANKTGTAFRKGVTSAPRTASFEDVALQAPAYGSGFRHNIMPDPSSSEDDQSQMSDSELSQFVASTRQIGTHISGDNTLEIKSLLSMDSMDDHSSSGLSVRDNSSRRLRTVAEIEALLSSELNDDNGASNTDGKEPETSRPRTVEEIESLLTADDDESIVELPFSDEDESIVE